MQIHWQCKHFDELNVHELYAIMKVRNEVFVVEQNCVFQDADGKDEHCYHLSGLVDKEIAAYARLVPAGISYSYSSIGRVITSPNHRKAGFGRALMTQAISECYRLFGKQTIKIGAQLYLRDFYQSFGFNQTSDTYLEDDIQHIQMLLEP